MELNEIKDWFKNYGGYLSPLVAFLLFALYEALYYRIRLNGLFHNFIKSIAELSHNVIVLFILIIGVIGILIFDKVLNKKFSDTPAVNQILGFIIFFFLARYIFIYFLFAITGYVP